MELYRRFFEQVHRYRENIHVAHPEKDFAGSNARIPPDVRSILDVGCGSGDFLNYLPDSYQKDAPV